MYYINWINKTKTHDHLSWYRKLIWQNTQSFQKKKTKTKNQEYKLGIELGTERNFLKLLKGIYEEL